jgi:hypothetical protein
MSATRFVLSYVSSGVGTVLIGAVSGNTITLVSNHIFNSESTYSLTTAVMSSNRFVVAYRDDGNSLYGTAIIGDGPIYPIGIATGSAMAGEDVPVIIRQAVSDVHSGLTIGRYYYGDISGNLSPTIDNYGIGIAISETEILLD